MHETPWDSLLQLLRAVVILALLVLAVGALERALKWSTPDGLLCCASALALAGAGALLTAVIRERRGP